MGGEGWLVCTAGFVAVAGVTACILRRLALDLHGNATGIYLKTRRVSVLVCFCESTLAVDAGAEPSAEAEMQPGRRESPGQNRRR